MTPAVQVIGLLTEENPLMMTGGFACRAASCATLSATPRPRPPGGPAVNGRLPGTRWRVREALRRDPDDRWAAVFGQIAGYSFAVAVVTGVLLLPFFRPSMATVVYPAPTGCWTAPR